LRYQDKPIEELAPIVENFILAYKQRTGVLPSKEELKTKLAQIIKEKESAQFFQTFESLTIKSIHTTLKNIDAIFEEIEESEKPKAEQTIKTRKTRAKK
jgi:hypothetical protein